MFGIPIDWRKLHECTMEEKNQLPDRLILDALKFVQEKRGL